MREVILANARYWLRVLQAAPNDSPIPEPDLRGAAKALEAALRVSDLWFVTRSLAQALHPHMEQRGFWADWDECLQVLVARARQQDDGQTEAKILLWRGVIERQRGEFRPATLSYLRAWQLYRREKNQLGLANVFSQLGDIYRLQGQFWRAEPLCLAAVRFFDAAAEHVGELARAENRLGLVYFDQFHNAQALPHFLRSEALWQQVSDPHGLAKVLQNLGELHRRSRDFEKASTYLERAVQHYLMAGDEINATRTNLDVGNIHLNQRNWQRAEAIYLQAETTLRRAGDSRDLAGARLNLGIVYTHMENWSEAEACFLRALEQWRARGDIWWEANTLDEMGMFHLARGDRMKAKMYLDQAWDLVRTYNGARFDLLRQELTERRKLVI